MMKSLFLAGIGLALLAAAPAEAQQHGPLGHYTARLSSRDHFNSNGERLKTVAAIIRQDRANVHKFGQADPEDQTDGFFDSPDMRAALERLLARRKPTPAVANAIINGEPLIHVDIFKGYILVTVL